MQKQQKFNTKSPIIFNEVEYGKYLYENSCNEELRPKIYNIKELTVLAKYFRWILKLPEEDVKRQLIRFCNINYIGFDPDVKYQEINKVMEDAYKTEIRSCNGVPITKSEWGKISLIEDDKAKKILFVMLAIAKFNRLNPVVYEEEESVIYTDTRLRCYLRTKDLFRLAKTSYRDINDYYKNYEEYIGKGLLDLIPSNRPKHILNFGEIECEEEDILVTIVDMDNLMEVYKKLSNVENMKQCKKCGRWFEDKSDKRKLLLCSGCRKQKNEIDKLEEEKVIKKKQSRKDQALESEIKLFTCIDCGEVFGKNKTNHKTKRCHKCQEIYEYSLKIKGTKTIVCTECGQEHNISAQRKVDICDKCYESILKQRGKKIIVCTECGEEFEGSTKSQRTLCDKCYKDYRRKQKTETMRKLRSKE